MSASVSDMWLLFLCCYSLVLTGGTVGHQQGVKVVVEEDSDAVLPCLISTEDLTRKLFDWKKDGQKEKKNVFIHDSGFTGQDLQFKGRVSHFQDQLKNGNASIKIQNTKMADSGNYSCDFQLQTFYIELVVERLLRDRSGEIPGASPKPYITTLDESKDWSLLQCEVRGASPKPKVEWQDSSGNILPAEKPQVSERRSSFSVTLKITVTKNDHYRCVVTQEELSHQIHSETFVFINEPQSREVKLLWLTTGLVVVVLLTVAVVCCRYRTTTPPDMKQDNDRRASENQADTEPTESNSHLGTPSPKKRFNIISHLQKLPHSNSYYEMLSTTPPDMKQDNDCRASENRADSEPTESNFCLHQIPPPPFPLPPPSVYELSDDRLGKKHSFDDAVIDMPSTTPPDMKQDNDRRASENRADTELTESNFCLQQIPFPLPPSVYEMPDSPRCKSHPPDHPEIIMSYNHLGTPSPKKRFNINSPRRKSRPPDEREELISGDCDPAEKYGPPSEHVL